MSVRQVRRPLTREPGRLLPGGGVSFLSWLGLVATLCAFGFAGVLAIAAVRAPVKRVDSSRLLIAVQAANLESPDAAAARSVDRLAGLSGVARAAVLDPPASVLEVGDGHAAVDPGFRWVQVTPSTPGTLAMGSLVAALQADGVRVAAPSVVTYSSGDGRAWLPACAIAAAGLALLALGLVWSRADNAWRRAATAVERLRSLGVAEPLLGGLLLRSAPAEALAASLAAAVLLVAGCGVFARLDLSLAVGGRLALADLWPLTFILPLPALFAAALNLASLERAGRRWP